MRKNIFVYLALLFSMFFIISITSNLFSVEKKPMTWEDIMKFKSLRSPIFSDDGNWLAYSEVPDRGDANIIVKRTLDTVKYIIPRGNKAIFSKNSAYVVSAQSPKAIDLENADKDKPKQGMAILRVSDGNLSTIDKVQSFVLSNDSKWLAYKFFDDDASKDKKDKKDKKELGTTVTLRYLETGAELTFPFVSEFNFDSLANYFTYIVREPESKKNGIFYIDLTGKLQVPNKIFGSEKFLVSNFAWGTTNSQLAYLTAKEDSHGEADSVSLQIWNSKTKETKTIVTKKDYPSNWYIPFKVNPVQWSTDGKRLFFGFKPIAEKVEDKKEYKYNDSDFYNVDSILRKRDLDLWHWNDPRIKPHQKHWWESNKDDVYFAVYDTEKNNWIKLNDSLIETVLIVENPNYTIGYDETPYLKEQTWSGAFKDLYLINLKNGTHKKIVEKLSEDADLSPLGKYVVYYQKGTWYLYDIEKDSTRNLTEKSSATYWNTDWDCPEDPPSYGMGGWFEDDASVLLYDKFDIWRFSTTDETYINQTAAQGVLANYTFRIKKLDPDKKFFKISDHAFCEGFNNKTKVTELWRLDMNILGPDILLHEKKRFHLIGKAKNEDRIFYSRESYDEFPNIWVTNDLFTYQYQTTDVNPEMNNYLWGKAELIDWISNDGDTLQGYIIKPDDYTPKKHYPTIVYFYERFSNELYRFVQPTICHRPCFPYYSGNGDYVFFLPDIKYKTGFPGPSAMSCIMPGIKKLINLGISDPEALGLWGHSWSGYQTLYMVTQTNKFSAAVAGAPVGNMTSAYSGIRLESGLARQFQYEKSQSRIGGNLWDSLSNYINNSPIFNAKNAQTPLLIMFGDEDGAVPWEQGQEIYLAFRRLNKNCLFLEYHNEGHWPNKYHNRLDYATRQKEFYDTYLLKKPAPEWITKGVEYKGNK